jgi:hypothetical protein
MSQDMQREIAFGRRGLQERLAAAEGAGLYDARGKRLGLFIEPVGDGSEVAIRRDGTFVWRRRVLPAAMVAAFQPEHGARGAVVLNVDDRTLKHSIAQTRLERDDAREVRAKAEDQLPSADEERVVEQELTSRLAPYVAASDRNDEERHLLFISTPYGYRLVEQDGVVPAVFDDVSLPGDDDVFSVIKVGHSPLARDRRVCAYLERK